jgi:sec-independent protein translocase protein TatB
MIEIAVILVVILIIFGPEDLPKIARNIGKIFGQARRVFQGFSKDFSSMMDEPVKEVKNIVGDIDDQAKSLKKSLDITENTKKSEVKQSADSQPQEEASAGSKPQKSAELTKGTDEPALLRYEELSQNNADSSQSEEKGINPLEALPHDLVRDKRD